MRWEVRIIGNEGLRLGVIIDTTKEETLNDEWELVGAYRTKAEAKMSYKNLSKLGIVVL